MGKALERVLKSHWGRRSRSASEKLLQHLGSEQGREAPVHPSFFKEDE